MYNFKHTTMKILNTFIVCIITNTVFRLPKFYKVYEIDTTIPGTDKLRTSYILDDRGEMTTIGIKKFEELKSNMLELGL